MRRPGGSVAFALAAAVACVIAFDHWSPALSTARFTLAYAAVLFVYVVLHGRLVLTREALIYAAFIGYMLVQLAWTRDRFLALNTLVPACNFLLAFVTLASLAALHDLKAVLAGAVAGFAAGAAAYSLASGFPLRYPAEFSYNAVAGMYLFGFLVTLLLAAISRRKALLLLLAAFVGAHIVATTSIKTNVGLLLGALAVALAHFRQVGRLLWRNAVAIVAVAAVLGYAIASSESAMGTLRRGAERVALGLQILQAREDLPGYSAFERRANWQREGFRGWIANPVFGHGVEAFRADYGFTSHASHVDLLYNCGVIGIAFFYGLFASVFLRLRRAADPDLRLARMVILGGTACALFMSFAGTIHYSAGLAGFLAIGVGVLKRG